MVKHGFTLRGVGMRYNGAAVLEDVNLDITGNRLVAVVGPNGAGKSTLLGILAGLRSGYLGECLYEGRSVKKWPRREFARRVSFVPQSLRLEFPFTAEQVVFMGRMPYGDGLFESDEDRAAVHEAMELTGTLAFRRRDFRSLSGGERQRVVLASALAQKPETLLLDEPTTFLDLKHQLSIYSILRSLCREGLQAIAATHDLNLASAFSDRVIVLHHGRVVVDSTPEQALTLQTLREVFAVDACIAKGPEGRPWIVYGQ
jgi:iron complex transport system ATP-binding protein